MGHGAATTLSQTDAPVADTDETLMARYALGDAGAFDTLYGRHRVRLFRYLLHQTRSQAIAEEIYQDVWMNLIGARERYVPSARFTTYLLTLAHNRVVDHFRRNHPTDHGVEPTEIDEVHVDVQQSAPMDPARQAELNQQVRRIDDALATLSVEQREIFLLRQESDLRLEDLAAITGVSRETAKSRLRYAVAHLRRLLGDCA